MEFFLKLYDDESVKEKLKVMSAWDAMLDDERNIIPEEYWTLTDRIKLGEKIKITIEEID